MIKKSIINPGNTVYINKSLNGAGELADKLRSINIHPTFEKNKVVNLKINSEDQIQEISEKIKNIPFRRTKGECGCEEPTILDIDPLKWENHEMGKCGFPFRDCLEISHRTINCLDCGKIVKKVFCEHNTSSFSFDQEKGWWVDSFCGLPKEAYFKSLSTKEQEKANGVRALLFREYISPSLEFKKMLPINTIQKEEEFASKIKIIKA